MGKYNEFAAATSVAIPIIQRDYVQGANVNFEKRDKFLESIFDALLNEKECKIDFIYGSSDNASEPLFLPVDGQQRLTTLALIGWILNQKSSMRFSGKLRTITYTTRPSTEQFCKELFNYELPPGCESISKHIKSVPGWYSERWQSDPSIEAMLELLDKANSMLLKEPYCSKVERMADCFFNNNPIMFERLDMEALNLNDDLYIKMNSRGKLLTPFENWKAEFEGYLKAKFPNVHYSGRTIPGTKGEPSLLEYFEYAIEHDWCDLLWNIAFERWIHLPEEAQRKVTYPRIDEFFMSLLDYVSRFLLFSSMKDVDGEAKKKGFIDIRMLYDHERNKSRIEVYDKAENVEKLFRIVDLLVSIKDKYNNFEEFFKKIFISTKSKERLYTTKVNLFDAETVDLVTLCFKNKLEVTTEVMLWAILEWLLQHPDCIEPDEPSLDNMKDFLRIIMGWARGRRQRLTNGLSVNTNLRLSNYYDANDIITQLASANDLFLALDNIQKESLTAEREKGKLHGTPRFDIIRELSTCAELYYCFNLLMPSLKVANNVQSYIDRFYEFILMGDDDRIRELNARGFKGVSPKRNYYFYGVDGKWDYVFTISKEKDWDNGYNAALEAFTNWMSCGPTQLFSPDKMAFYIQKYPDFIKSRNNHQYEENPCHYFIRNNEFEAWAVKTFSTQPIRGYNVDPYGYTVEKLYPPGSHKLYAESDNSTHGLLWIDEKGITMECCVAGWRISIIDTNSAVATSFRQRFNVGINSLGKTTYVDSQGVFDFDETVMKDLKDKDRIESALALLGAI